jgi:hypothetical protein
MKTRGLRVPRSESGTSSKRSVTRCATSYIDHHGICLGSNAYGAKSRLAASTMYSSVTRSRIASPGSMSPRST